MDQVCQDKIGRLGGVAGSVMLYVTKLEELHISRLLIKIVYRYYIYLESSTD
jgi:hypothetical protein